MALLAAGILAAALLESDELGAARLLHEFCGDLGARDDRRTNFDIRTRADEEDLAELDRGSGIACDPLDRDDVVFGNAILLSACLDDSVHGSYPSVVRALWRRL